MFEDQSKPWGSCQVGKCLLSASASLAPLPSPLVIIALAAGQGGIGALLYSGVIKQPASIFLNQISAQLQSVAPWPQLHNDA